MTKTSSKQSPRRTVLCFYVPKGTNCFILQWPAAARDAGAYNQTIVGGGVGRRESAESAIRREVGQELGNEAVKKAQFFPLIHNPEDFLYEGSRGVLKQGIPFFASASGNVQISPGREVANVGRIPIWKGFEESLRPCTTPAKMALIARMRDLSFSQYPEHFWENTK